MRVLVFGTGKYYVNRKEYIDSDQIIGFLDNDTEKQGKQFDGKEIFQPEEIVNWQFDYVLIMSIYFDEMRKQLLSLNISETKIINFDTYCILDIFSDKELMSYAKEIDLEFYLEVLEGKRNCTNGKEIWQYYDFLKLLIKKMSSNKNINIDKYKNKMKGIFMKQLLSIDIENIWNE